MIDLSAVDILSVAERYTSLRRTSSYKGGQYSGACPVCGRSQSRQPDCFSVYPAEGKWFCRRCDAPAGGDALSLVARLNNLNLRSADGMRQALVELGLQPGQTTRVERRPASPPPETQPPSAEWQDRAAALMVEAQVRLWSTEGERALAYLHKRGLRDQTIKDADLGYIPGQPTEWIRPEGWVIQTDKDKEARPVSVPCGIVIPHIHHNVIWGIRVRRAAQLDGVPFQHTPTGFVAESNSKYEAVTGTRKSLYIPGRVQHGMPIVLDEGELNALSIWQTSSDVVMPIALVSASYAMNIEQRWWPILLGAPTIYARMDNDSAGMKAVAKLGALSARVRSVVVPPPHKDPNDLLQQGHLVLDRWVRGLLHD
ncbi:MAG: toprim domain-containing protein [Phototrophicaceae bacterium]